MGTGGPALVHTMGRRDNLTWNGRMQLLHGLTRRTMGRRTGMARQKDRLGSADLGIDLSGGKDSEVFKWFVACDLFGRRISQDIAAETFTQLDNDGVVTPQKLANADWQHLVDLLGQGGYKRYDESTASELIKLGQDTVDRYDGSLANLAKDAQTKKAVRDRLQEFKGIGPTSADIFLREMGPIWNV